MWTLSLFNEKLGNTAQTLVKINSGTENAKQLRNIAKYGFGLKEPSYYQLAKSKGSFRSTRIFVG